MSLVMTLYEQIERAVRRAEKRDLPWPDQAEAAREAGMGERSFRTWFWAVTGHTWRDYLTRRRLAEAARELSSSDAPVLTIALDAGYETHEAFTRAFRREFTVSPRDYRKRGGAMDPSLPPGLERIVLFKELYMGVIVKELPVMKTVYFDGFQPNPEDKAKALLKDWTATHKAKAPRRVFGHNIDEKGNLGLCPEYAGYRFYCTCTEEEAAEAAGEATTSGAAAAAGTADIRGGTFVVTGIEGNFDDDPSGAWIGAGWERMNAMMREKGYRVKSPARWFEEELESEKPGNLRLDLYLEIEEGASR